MLLDNIDSNIYKIPITPPKGSSMEQRQQFYNSLIISSLPSLRIPPWINEMFGWCERCKCLVPFNYDESIINYEYNCPVVDNLRMKAYKMSHAYAIFRRATYSAQSSRCYFSVIDASLTGFGELLSDFMEEHPEVFPASLNDIEYYLKK